MKRITKKEARKALDWLCNEHDAMTRALVKLGRQASPVHHSKFNMLATLDRYFKQPTRRKNT